MRQECGRLTPHAHGRYYQRYSDEGGGLRTDAFRSSNMGIDIYAHWKGQSEDEKAVQWQQWLSIVSGSTGYLREAYHGVPYATQYLCAEAFDAGAAEISAAVLRKRLPHTLVLVERRMRRIYKSKMKAIEEVQQSFTDFVALCEQKEKETGQPVRILASY